MTTVEERVAKGAAFLDEKRPFWFESVDLDILDLWNYRSCVLGQLYDAYCPALERLGIDDETSIAHGFEGSVANNVDYGTDCRELTEQWRKEIMARRERRNTPMLTGQMGESTFSGTLTIGGTVINIPSLPLDVVAALAKANA